MACGQSLLHEVICLFCGTEVQDYDRKGCGEGFQAGLDTVKTLDKEYMKKQLRRYPVAAPRNWYRRNIYKERAYLSDSGKRFGAWKADLVWRKG
ncbi:MAG: hypothetical protein HS132_02130 [Planctomycetia bacterium]|nr:hypothetical protein [Planctomycetia bacterium]